MKTVKRGKPAGATVIHIAADWEERLSMFLRDAIDAPHREPEVCEELIEFVQHLIRLDRGSYRERCFDVVCKLYGKERRRTLRIAR